MSAKLAAILVGVTAGLALWTYAVGKAAYHVLRRVLA